MIRRFMALYDLHWGYERSGGHKRPIHDPRAWAETLTFLRDFRPHDLVLGGDILDCSAISHHNHGKPGRTEGLRLLDDMKECAARVLDPLDALLPKGARKMYHIGNHEHWIEDLIDDNPTLSGLIDLEAGLRLTRRGWTIIPQGGVSHLGKLHFIHGDQIRGGEHVAKQAVLTYERSIRLGHFHTYQAYTKTSAIDNKQPKTGIAVPCLCRKDPTYTQGRPSRWAQGFLWGYIRPDGFFTDYVHILTHAHPQSRHATA